jgi:hypothetical protein
VRLFWKFEDILIDVPLAAQFLAQLLSFLHLRQVISPAGILTQIPQDVLEKLMAVESFRGHFAKEIEKLSEEKEYRLRAQNLIQQYYSNFDESELDQFLSKEIKERHWELFNHLFIRKAIDYALDLGSNEKNACSNLLYKCTHDFNF